MAEQKWATDERRLHSAYDDVSFGRLKSAKSTVDRHLKKHPQSQPGLVLRMVILSRSRAEEDDVLKVYESIKKTGELTARSLWNVDSTFQSLGRDDLSISLYQDLWAKSPDRAEFGEQVFLHAAASENLDVMVESSRKMFNKLKSPVWARVAAWSEWVKNAPQPKTGDDFPSPAPKNVLRVSTTLLSTTRRVCEYADIYWLHLQILISSDSLSDALSVAQASGGDGSLMRLWYRMKAVTIILERMKAKGEDTAGAWLMEWDWAKSKLQDEQHQRNYAFYRYLILALVNLLGTPQAPTDGTIDTLKMLNKEICSKERAPALALLDLDKELKSRKDSLTLSLADWEEALKAYWARWGSKGSFVSEVEGLIADDAEKEGVVKRLFSEQKKEHTSLDEYRRVVYTTLYLLRQHPETWSTSPEDVQSLWTLYLDGLQYGRNLPKTDVQPCDDVGLAAVHCLVMQWSKSQDDEKPLHQAVLCLEYILQKSPNCKGAELLLGRILRLIGATSLSRCTVKSALQWNEIQIDNLAHFSHDRASVESYIHRTTDGWSEYEGKARRMYARSRTDLPESMKQALQTESYSAIPGIKTVSSTLKNSLSRGVMAVEQARLSILTREDISANTLKDLSSAAEAAKMDQTVDTRDWSLMPDLGPRRGPLKDPISMGNVPGQAWVAAWANVLLRVHKLGQAQATSASADLQATLKSADLLLSERAYLLFINNVLQKVSPPQSNGASSATTDDLNLDDFFSTIPTAPKTAHFSRLYPVYLLVELRHTVNHTIRILSQKPQSAKTQPKSSQSSAELVKQLKAITKTLQDKSSDMIPIIEELKSSVQVGWEVSEKYQLDNEMVKQVEKSITDARVKGLDRVIDQLKQKS